MKRIMVVNEHVKYRLLEMAFIVGKRQVGR